MYKETIRFEFVVQMVSNDSSEEKLSVTEWVTVNGTYGCTHTEDEDSTSPTLVDLQGFCCISNKFFFCCRAVDGNFQSRDDGIFLCTHTEDDMNTPTPWWTVDLQGIFFISSVTITNRRDCCGETVTESKCWNNFRFDPSCINTFTLFPFKLKSFYFPGLCWDKIVKFDLHI